MGDDGAAAAQALLQSVNKPAQGVLGTIVGVVLLGVGAISVFGELQNALDRIWRAPGRAGSGGVWALVRARLLSFGMVLGIGFLLIVSLVASAAVAALGKFSAPLFGSWVVLAEVLELRRQLRLRDRDLRDDLQDHAARAHRLARRLDRRRRDGAAVRDRQVADRPVPRPQHASPPASARPARSSCCSSGCTTRRRSSCSARSSRWVYAHAHGSRAQRRRGASGQRGAWRRRARDPAAALTRSPRALEAAMQARRRRQ